MAQIDPHFSQYYMNPLWLNPALTGAIDGDFRISAVHREQWRSIADPFITTSLSADLGLNGDLNIGIDLLEQTAGDVGYKYDNANLSLSYSGIRFGKEGYKVVTLALKGGAIARQFDFSRAKVSDQFDGTGYNPGLPRNESGFGINTLTSTKLDLGGGILFYDADPTKKANLFCGFSMAHLNQATDPFAKGGYGSKLPMRGILHAGANITLSKATHLVPNGLFMQQGNAQETMFGCYVETAVNELLDLSVGANYRMKDAIYPYLGLSYNDFTFGLSYDVNVSNLNQAAGATGSFELSLMYMDRKKQKGFFKCPRF